MLILKSFEDCLHYCFPEKLRFVFYPEPGAVNTKGSHFPVIKHQCKSVTPSKPVFFMYRTPHLLWFSDQAAKLKKPFINGLYERNSF